MNKKGIVSSVNNEKRKARIIFPDLGESVSDEISIAGHIQKLTPGDTVIVAFLDDRMVDGIIVGSETRIETINQSSTYTYTQISPSNEWFIFHNLNKRPSVTIVDSGGNVVVGEVVYIDDNNIKISFTAEFSGKAYLN